MLLDEFSRGRDFVRPMSDERKANSSIKDYYNITEAAWLDRVDQFDHKFFHLSLAEAELMDPRQRLMMQLAVDAVYNAGYSLKDLKGKNIAVIIASPGAPKPCYYDNLNNNEKNNPLSFTGNLQALLAGRISHFLNLRGIAYNVDTACSSFGVAMHQAKNLLLNNEVDAVLVGSLTILDEPLPKKVTKKGVLGVESQSGRCKSFSKNADGAGYGEGGGFVFLKRSTDAIKDKDFTHVLLIGSAVNHDGALCNGITAPSLEAQKEVLISAWMNANLSKSDLGYIEAHGTGTRIGDPIEIEALTSAFKLYGYDGKCVVSSAKSNFAHLGSAAAFIGFIRAMISLKQKKIFPTVHFQGLNDYIKLTSSVQIGEDCQEWNKKNRFAGISSFGLSGTNCHIVLQSFDNDIPSTDNNFPPFIFTLAAYNKDALKNYILKVNDYLKNYKGRYVDLTFVSNIGRDHYPCRLSVVVGSLTELKEKFKKILESSDNFIIQETYKDPVILVKLSPEDALVEDINILEVLNYLDLGIKIDNVYLNNCNLLQKKFIWTYIYYKFLLRLQIENVHWKATTLGKFFLLLIKSKTFNIALKNLQELNVNELRDDYEKNNITVSEKNCIAIVPFISKKNIAQDEKYKKRFYSNNSKAIYKDIFLNLVSWLYNRGFDIDWSIFYYKFNLQRLEFPSYPFDDIRCWHNPAAKIENITTLDDSVIKGNISQNDNDFILKNKHFVQDVVIEAISKVLKVENIKLQDDFFALGGNSLNGVQVVEEVSKRINIKSQEVDVYMFFECESINDIVILFSNNLQSEEVEELEENELEKKIEYTNQYKLSFQQLAIWSYINIFPEKAHYYNIPGAYAIDGKLDVGQLEKSLNYIIKNHQMLRSNIYSTKKDIYQKIKNYQYIELEVIKCQNYQLDSPEIKELLEKNKNTKFDLEKDNLFKFQLIELNFDKYILLLVFHHIIFDGWSWRIFLEQLEQIYNAPELNNLFPNNVQINCIEYIQEETMKYKKNKESLENFWKSYLQGGTGKVNFPDYVRNNTGDAQKQQELFSLDYNTTSQIRKFASSNNTTTNVVLLSIFIIFLYDIVDQSDISISVPVARRNKDNKNFIGCFVDYIIQRFQIDGNITFKEHIYNCKKSCFKSLSHQEISFFNLSKLLNNANDIFDQPDCDVFFDFHNKFESLDKIKFKNFKFNLIDASPSGSKKKFGLTCIEMRELISMRLEYETLIFSKESINFWISRFIKLISICILNYNDKISELTDIMGDDEKYTKGFDDFQ